jgi:transcription initiation factor TFIIIB Brf1 subunit/transcription initiation factor TFIIB
MKENINDIVDHVAQELEKDRRRIMIENYINRVVSRVQLSTEVDMAMIEADSQVESEIKAWKKANKTIVAYKVSEAARYILRQELLGE